MKNKYNTIDALIHKAMCRDRHGLQRRLYALKKAKKDPQALLKSAQSSAAQRQRRADSIPTVTFDPDLPITSKKEEIIQAIKDHPVLIISGETGSGKTTQIPKFCLAAGRGTGGMIGCTQPRRIAAMTVAKRIAVELNQELGQSVGYKIRFDDHTPAHAHIKLMTDGILLAETQQDRFLTQYDTLIVDEAHERSLNIDFTLGILRRLVKQRKDLKLIITSATIDTEKFSQAFDNAPVIEVSGRMFPVELIYAPIESAGHDEPSKGNTDTGADDQGYVEAAARAAANILSRTRTGDILIFMPTEQDIGETMEILRGKNHPGVSILPLFARLSAKEQAKVFAMGAGRKVVVSTNVAETSLTIPGIKYVVDTGLARIPAYSPRTRTTALPVSPISQSSANQRMGRCGRVENGICIRLYDEAHFNGRPFFTAPEILRSNLAEVILRMISLGLGEVSTFPFIDAPAPKSIKDGVDTLLELSAIRRKKIRHPKKKGQPFALTPMGQLMARLPLDPKLSRILIEAGKSGCLKEAVIITTALTVSDIRQRPADKAQAADQKHGQFKDPSSDFITLLNIWNACQDAGNRLKSRSKVRKWCIENYLSFKRLREWQDIHRQVTRLLREHGITEQGTLPPAPESRHLKSKIFEHGGPLYIALHKSLLHGYLAGIAHKKENNTYTAAKGQQAAIFPGSGLFKNAGAWIVAAEYVKTSQLFARCVANIDPGWVEDIAGELCTRTYSDPHWEKKRGEVMAKEQVSLFGLILVSGRSVAYGKINPQESGELFIRHALVEGEIFQKFGFMAHNLKLMAQVAELENKTRQRDILASEEDIFLFYQSRLPKPFYNIRTFARFIKDQKDDGFLCMSLEDLQKSQVDGDLLAQFPDQITMAQGEFALSYEFNPGAASDGVTLRVPADATALVSRNQVDALVPGLFKEKIQALIRALPKKYRVKLVPVQDTAARIARELPQSDKALYTRLSEFIRDHYKLTIPADTWSDSSLPDHLKMRISIRDEQDREIKSLRDLGELGQFQKERSPSKSNAFDNARAHYEKIDINTWDFPDLPSAIPLAQKNGFSRQVFLGLNIEGPEAKLALRLFKSRSAAVSAHKKGIAQLFQRVCPDHINALKKDIRTNRELKRIAPYFQPKTAKHTTTFQDMVYNCTAREFLEKDIRTRKAFQAHVDALKPTLYQNGQEVIRAVMAVGQEYDTCFTLIQTLSLKYQDRPLPFDALTRIFNELKNICPPHFPELYGLDRIRHLPRHIACLTVRARNAADNPAKEGKKAALIAPFERRLNALIEGLTDQSSQEKADRVEDFFWMLKSLQNVLKRH